MWKNWIITALGAWLFVSSFVTGLLNPVNLFIVGALALVFGFWGGEMRSWARTVDGVGGIWLVISAFVPPLVSAVNFAAAGLVMLVLGLLSMNRRAARMTEQAGA